MWPNIGKQKWFTNETCSCLLLTIVELKELLYLTIIYNCQQEGNKVSSIKKPLFLKYAETKTIVKERLFLCKQKELIHLRLQWGIMNSSVLT